MKPTLIEGISLEMICTQIERNNFIILLINAKEEDLRKRFSKLENSFNSSVHGFPDAHGLKKIIFVLNCLVISDIKYIVVPNISH